THDVEEALKMADLLVVMRDGRILQADSPRTILAHPADPFVAQLVGAGDALRQLSLVPVTEVMRPLDGARPASANGDGHTIGDKESAREALALLIGGAARSLTVVGDDGRTLGTVSLDDVHASAEAEALPV
ncbi:MAG: ABC transporter ATP-binding protein, partial [Chloroflexota bacterium]|nr:ABC transporter ATP-binding protein [Chloroflexota bacterium]